MKRFPLLRLAAEGVATGLVSGLVVNALCLMVTGRPASLMVLLLASQAAGGLWSFAQAVRFRRKWQTVLASYSRPALGEGIDIPHRPPTLLDDEGEAA